VQIAGTINYVPMSRIGSAQLFDIQGRPPARAGDRPSSWVNVVGGRYFEAMGIPLRRGRLPGANDTDRSRPVFVIDEELARRFWPQQNPIGAELAWPGPGNTSVSGEVVGVVGGVRWTGMAAERNPTTYFWFPQNPGRQLTLVIRTAGDPLETARPVADAIAAVDPRLPIASMRPMSDFVSDDLSRPRAVTLCLAGFAAAALFLSAIGLYGVTAFGVAQRRYEIGVRIALGAQRRDVFWLVMRRVLRLTLSGMACGVVLALGTGRLIAGLLYGIEPSDVETLIAAVLFLASVGFAAGFLPARRAVRVDPIELLRAD
jgi:predicted permease